MRYISFEISNFRGIEHARVDLCPTGAGVFTLIGLNESGKTTVLEAISSFRIEASDEKSLYQSAPIEEDPASFVPKHKKANFSGDITVVATVEFEAGDKERCANWAQSQSKWKIDIESIPDRFSITRGHRFANSDRTRSVNEWDIGLRGKAPSGKKVRDIEGDDAAWGPFVTMMKVLLPEIVYFPTFIFDQPERIVLNPQADETDVDKLYRKIIENIGSSLPSPIDVKTHIVDRLLKPSTVAEQWTGWFGLDDNKRQQVESAIDLLSSHLSETVFDSWSKVFGRSFSGREVRLKLGTDQFEDGSPRIYIQIGLKDGKQQYNLAERSLGFRWFFSFLLFTLYRSKNSRSKKTLFLLDEPASNLHSSAQTQLMDSFPRITADGNFLMYSTHSHYLINPHWLDQAFIVSNKAVDYEDVSDAHGRGAEHTDVRVEKYRTFVGSNPDKPTYFQPVLDRLQVLPSRLDSLVPSVLLEGKGDYLIIKYGLGSACVDLGEYAVLPTRGADHFGEIVGILLGWGVNFALCFDDDPKGKKVRAEYAEEWGLGNSRSFTLADCDPSLKGRSVEGFLEPSDLDLIQKHFELKKLPTKGQIQLFFSEALANGTVLELSSEFKNRIIGFDKKVREGLGLST